MYLVLRIIVTISRKIIIITARTFTNTNMKKSMATRKPRSTRSGRVTRRVVPLSRGATTTLRRANRRVRNMRRRVNRAGRVNGGNTAKLVKGPKITQEGLAFLKCAFAPPDFSDTKVVGIPDAYRGKTLLKKHRFTASYPVDNIYDYYLLLLPTPGIAYWSCVTLKGVLPTSASVWTPVAYSDISQMFYNETNAADVVNSYRYVSNHFELISTTNEMSWSGSISVMKLNPALITRWGSADIYGITGLNGTISTNAPMYSGPTKAGVYLGCYNANVDFDFQPILEGVPAAKIPYTVATGEWGQLDASSINVLPGFYNGFESALIKISSMSTLNTFVLKTWACVEYKVVPNSTLLDYTSVSPPEDYTAMKAYREIVLTLPLAVPAAMNAGFWDRVLSILRTVTGAGSFIPGPFGVASGGIHTALTAF